MSDRVHSSLAAVQSMETACEQFARVVLAHLPSVEHGIRQVAEALEERSVQLRLEITSLEAEISSAEEGDDKSWARSRLLEVEEELASVDRRSRRLALAGASITGRVSRLESLTTDHAVRAREFLRGAADDLKMYLARTYAGVGSDENATTRETTRPDRPDGSGCHSTPTASMGGSTARTGELCDADAKAFRTLQGALRVEAKLAEFEQRLHQYPELSVLTPEEFLAINRYTQHDYEEINEALRANHSQTLEKWGAHIRLAIRGLRKLPQYEGVVHRAVDRVEITEKYVPGNIFGESAFTSGSRDFRSSASFGKHRFEIHSKRGRDVRCCSAMQSSAADEREVLFEPNTRFLVAERYVESGTTVVRLREV